MQTIKAATGFYIPAENISFVSAYNFNFIRNYVRKKTKEEPENIIDITRGKKILTAVFLKNGEIVLLNTSAETINSRFEEMGQM